MKKIITFLIIFALALASTTTSIFADETPSFVAKTETSQPILDIEFTSDMINEDGYIELNNRYFIDSTFKFIYEYTSQDFVYTGSSIMFSVEITEFNGNTPGDTVDVEIKDYFGSTYGFTAYANGNMYGFNTSITPGLTYYFYFKNITSSWRKLKVHLVVC